MSKSTLLIIEPDAYGSEEIRRLGELYEVHAISPESKSDLVQLLNSVNPEVLIVGLGFAIGKTEVGYLSGLKFVLSPTTGNDHLEMEELRSLGISVLTLRDVASGIQSVASTAELAWGLLLAIARNVVPAAVSTSKGEWQRGAFRGTELRGKTLGIVGLGRLGKFMADYGSAFGMQVVASDPEAASYKMVEILELSELLGRSDVISIHVPLNEKTQSMIGEHQISRMKPGVLIVNTSRGEIVDERAIAEAIRVSQIGGFATDVLSGETSWEGRIESSPIWELQKEGFNVVMTPHIGGYTSEAIRATRRLLIDHFLTMVEPTKK